MAKGDSERESTKELRVACRKADQWARTHASVFDPKKYALVHFVNTREIDPQYTPLSLQGYTVTATRTAERYLGYWLDPSRTWVTVWLPRSQPHRAVSRLLIRFR